jgi:alpha-glucosidase
MSGDVPVISTKQFVQTLREFNGGIPWRSLLASMNLLDSHDTARMRNIVGGDRDRHIAAMTLLLTYPGVPSIYQGDEIGIEGAWVKMLANQCHGRHAIVGIMNSSMQQSD